MPKNVTAKTWSLAAQPDGRRYSDTTVLSFDGPAELPRFLASWSTAYALPGGNVWTATNTSASSVAGTGTGNRTDCSLPYALANCQRGDVIRITRGADYKMRLNLPAKSGTGWIYIVPDDMAFLPAEGTRIVPGTHATNMPKITDPTTNGWPGTNSDYFTPTIGCDAAASYYRFVGIEIRTNPLVAGGNIWSLVWLGKSASGGYWSDPAQLPHNITFDRCWIHGASNHAVVCALRLHGNYMAVLDSVVNEIKTPSPGNDSQAINIINGYGPFRFRRNALSATGEIVLTGGGAPAITNLIPGDIELCDNYVYWDPAWQGGTIPVWTDAGGTIANRGLTLKNHFEFKIGQRILVERNKFENCWAAAQQGQAIYACDGDESAPNWSTTRDLTVRFNHTFNVGTGFMLASNRWLQPNITPPSRISVHDNLFRISNSLYDGFRTDGSSTTVVIDHNTFIVDDEATYPKGIEFTNDASSPGPAPLTYTNNIVVCRYPIWSPGNAQSATAVFGAGGIIPGATYTANVLVAQNQSTSGYPAGNFLQFDASFPANVLTVGFVDFAGANFALSGGSAYKNAGTDGKDIGANISQVAA